MTEEFPIRLLAWYDENKRDLPWRKESNPYYTWVSEIMLQQTRVDTVIPYFNRFIEQFPTLESLAEADEDEVLKAWEGLGYYSRARNLHTAVKEVKEQYGGVVPRDKEKISRLRGIGPYTAGAILSIAFNIPAPAVDGNVMRVYSRLFALEDDVAKGSTRAYMERLSEQMIPCGRAGDFTQALMELGALVCTPKSPQCLLCPAMDFCQGRIRGIHESLPVKKKSKAPRPVRMVAAFVYRDGDDDNRRFLIRKRPSEGLLAGLWEIPSWECPAGEERSVCLQNAFYKQYGTTLTVESTFGTVDHTFSHLHWTVEAFQCRLDPAQSSQALDSSTWVTLEEALQNYTFPNVFHKIMSKV